MRFLADLVYLLAGLAYLPVAIYQALVLQKNRRGWRQRFGSVPTRPAGVPRVWMHAVSLGEVNATPRLIEALKRDHPGLDIVVSTTTDTGYARAVQLYGAGNVVRFPLDFSLVVTRALRRLRPTMIVLVELEVWYNLIHQAHAREIPIAVVNGRLTEKSARRFARLGSPVRSMFARLAQVCAQDETIAARFRALGTPPDRIEVTSSLKWDSALVADTVEGATALAAAMGIDPGRPILVCGSTGPGEEEQILHAWARAKPPSTEGVRPLLIIVPRKPERFDEVARLIMQKGYPCLRRSAFADGSAPPEPDQRAVILGDTMGELRKFYALARVVFVGRTLVPLGGSDPMEVAGLGKPVIVGPHTENFALPVQALAESDAVRRVESADQLADLARELLSDSALARALGKRAQGVVRARQGATERTAAILDRLLGAALGRAAGAGFRGKPVSTVDNPSRQRDAVK